jgi:hypothetical protein
MKHELVQLASKIDWQWLDGEIAPLYSDKRRPGIETRFVIGLLLLKHIFALAAPRMINRDALRLTFSVRQMETRWPMNLHLLHIHNSSRVTLKYR